MSDVWIVLGTRPEAIKQIPLYLEARKRWGVDRVKLVCSGQHPDLLKPIFEIFDVQPDFEFQFAKTGLGLSEMSSLLLSRAAELFKKGKPRLLVVQGDTSTAAMLGLAAFYEQKIQVVHNEAGLRSGNNRDPFPEELNRKILASLSDYHLAPTHKAYEQLLREGVLAEKIVMAGNTGIDALVQVLNKEASPDLTKILLQVPANKKIVLMTAHRRENQGDSFANWFEGLAGFLRKNSDLFLIYPQHPNAFAREACEKYLGVLDNVLLTGPLDYLTTSHLLSKAAFIVTDSGGLQEEGASLGVPVVVCRKTTERSEAIDAGYARLAGTSLDGVLAGCEWALELSKGGALEKQWPFGHGDASLKICDAFESWNLIQK
jgi:UDP-N-acetylglucosamine 2-epimerase